MMLSPWLPPRYLWSAIEGARRTGDSRPRVAGLQSASSAPVEVAGRAQPPLSRLAIGSLGSLRGASPNRRSTQTSSALAEYELQAYDRDVTLRRRRGLATT